MYLHWRTLPDMDYADRTIHSKTSAKDVQCRGIIPKEPLEEGGIRRAEYGCPNCGRFIGDKAKTPPGCMDVLPVKHITKIHEMCDHCTCVFTRVFRMEYLHSKVDIPASPPEEEEVKVGGPKELRELVLKGVGVKDPVEDDERLGEPQGVETKPKFQQSIDLTVG